MRIKGAKYLPSIVLAAVMTACGVTKHLPEDKYMLVGSKVIPDKEAPRKERIPAGTLEKYVPQSATKKFLGTNLPAWIYLQAGPDTLENNKSLLRAMGSEPVLLDTSLTQAGARNLKLYMDSRGFYESSSDYSIKYNDKRRKAKVKYTAEQGEPLRIRNVSYDFRDSFVEQIIREDSARTRILPGNIFDTEMLRDERQRIADKLHNSGYYNFSIGNISFKVDTTVGGHLADVTMVVKQHLAGYDEKGDPILENNSIYSIKEIYVLPDYDPVLAADNPAYRERLDTTEYRGLKILTPAGSKSNIKPHTLRRAINIYPDYLYNYDQVQRTYNDLLRLDYYKNARIIFTEVSLDEEGQVTYVGDEEADSAIHTSRKQLDCLIMATPGLKQGYSIELEGMLTSSYYGTKLGLNYQNRNLFRGAEVFAIGLTGGYEYYPPKKNPDMLQGPHSYEIGANVSITFPRFITPFPVDRANRATRPQTKFEVSINKQRRPLYHRTISGGSIAYNWGNGRHSNYQLRPLDLSVINMTYIDPAFEKDLEDRNPYLKNSYRSQFIPAIGGSYIYNNPSRRNGNSLTFRLNIETAGNLTGLLSSLFMDKSEEKVNRSSAEAEMVYKPFGIRYSQYVRVESSISNNIVIWEKTSVAYRLLGGIGLPYGNSSVLPLDRQFYVGGINSMRGWPVRTLGPGGTDKTAWTSFRNQTGNMRLEANLEFRFPVWNSLRGAVFLDAGNIWNVNIKGGQAGNPEAFRFDTFASQLGFNTGIGLRFDVNIAVIRLDWGIRLHDPNEPAGQRWIHNFRFSNTAINFGIGYPF